MIANLIQQVQELLNKHTPNQLGLHIEELKSLKQDFESQRKNDEQIWTFQDKLNRLITLLESLQPHKEETKKPNIDELKVNLNKIYELIIEHPVYHELHSPDQAMASLSDMASKRTHVKEIHDRIADEREKHQARATQRKADDIYEKRNTISEELDNRFDIQINSFGEEDLNQISSAIKINIENINQQIAQHSVDFLLNLSKDLACTNHAEIICQLNSRLDSKLSEFNQTESPLTPSDDPSQAVNGRPRDKVNDFESCNFWLDYYLKQKSSLNSYASGRGWGNFIYGSLKDKNTRYDSKIPYLQLWKEIYLLQAQLTIVEKYSSHKFSKTLSENSVTDSSIKTQTEDMIQLLKNLKYQETIKSKINRLIELNKEWNELHHAQIEACPSTLYSDNIFDNDVKKCDELEGYCLSFLEKYSELDVLNNKKKSKGKSNNYMKQIKKIHNDLCEFRFIPKEAEDCSPAASSQISFIEPSHPEPTLFQSELDVIYNEILRIPLVSYEMTNWIKKVYETCLNQHDIARATKLLADIQFELHSVNNMEGSSTINQYRLRCPEPQTQIDRLLELKPKLRSTIPEPVYDVRLNRLFEQLEEQKQSLTNRGYHKEASLIDDVANIYLQTAAYGETRIWGNNRNWSLLNDPRFDCLKTHRGGLMQLWQTIETFVRNLGRRMIGLLPHQTPQCMFSTRSIGLMNATEQILQAEEDSEVYDVRGLFSAN